MKTLITGATGQVGREAARDLAGVSVQARAAEYEKAMGISNRTATNQIKKLVDLSLLRRRGAGPATFYEMVRP